LVLSPPHRLAPDQCFKDNVGEGRQPADYAEAGSEDDVAGARVGVFHARVFRRAWARSLAKPSRAASKLLSVGDTPPSFHLYQSVL
jgi:hypothetical protein